MKGLCFLSSLFERLWRNWIAHRSSEPRVGGSNPFRRVLEVFLVLLGKPFLLLKPLF